jgi:transcriptional regulator with PAS, ATPase and Fis domain
LEASFVSGNKKIVILNVDDTKDSLRIKTVILQRAGFEAIESSSGLETLKLAAIHHPELILLDVNLPDMSGYDVCRELKSNPATASTLVIHISACFTKGSDRTRGLDGGADGYLTSPVEPPLLVATIKSLLRVREAEAARNPVCEYWQATFDAVTDGIALLDGDGRIIKCNAACEALVKRTSRELIGRTFRQIQSDSLANQCDEIPFVIPDCSTRQATEKECFGKRLHITCDPIRDSQGRSIGSVCIFADAPEPPSGMEQKRTARISASESIPVDKPSLNRGFPKYEPGELASCSEAMQATLKLLPQIAASNSTVLIQGETGTGKELLAKTIHELSPRASKPLIIINSAAVPDNLLESELFGYCAGAFTGAARNKPGQFTLAGDGTIFLDEIGDLSPALQVKLLRVLQERTYIPLGGIQPERTNARFIVATNRRLSELVRDGQFRADLYYRLNVIALELPALRQRKEDLPLLITRIIQKLNLEYGKQITGVSNEVMTVLQAHEYPGNIRELANILEHAHIVCTSQQIGMDHLPGSLTSESSGTNSSSPGTPDLKSVEIRTVMEGLKRNSYNRLATARELGIHKSTLFRKLKEWGIMLPEHDGRSKKK